ncbi:D-alanine aminotransferase [Dongia mobilis]|uniref:Probable branched-chain-amino-acid aminotransferase n=1 Tax=Dongia mobilis TaxID=578943 RepID=A0A4R6WW74_9PROT|nr:D-amino-acid transaminase [Dongia mobilis]TDQ81528.1 D-alanine aminotransferase [Dongia mobilis]
MGRVAYVNGRYVPHGQANVHIEDRGYQFADGVYEVVPVIDGVLIDEELHLDRLGYSLGELRIAWPVARPVLRLILREMLARNHLGRGIIYFQVTRGVAPRDHKFPARTKSSLVVTTKRLAPPAPALLENGVAVASQPDIRWQRCDIKSLSLLPNILAKQAAHESGAFEAWLVDANGVVTEGSSTNAWIVTRSGEIVTHPTGRGILGGVTRRSLVQLAEASGLALVERGFTLVEAQAAAEAFLTSSSAFVLPVTRIDGQPVGDGRPGPVTRRLREIYLANVAAQIGAAP